MVPSSVNNFIFLSAGFASLFFLPHLVAGQEQAVVLVFLPFLLQPFAPALLTNRPATNSKIIRYDHFMLTGYLFIYNCYYRCYKPQIYTTVDKEGVGVVEAQT